MIVDSSVLIALILQEPGHQKIGRVLRVEDTLHMSTATWVELGVVADRRLSEVNQHRLDAMIDGLGIVLVPLSVAQARRARQAHRRYGPCSGSAARLNMGEPRRLSRRRCEAPASVNHAGLRTPLMTAITKPTTARPR